MAPSDGGVSGAGVSRSQAKGRGAAFDSRRRVARGEALAALPGPGGERFRTLFRHGTLEVEIYAPLGRDPQTPHTRDEVYVVISGSGTFVSDLGREPFGPGDFLFAPAGTVHRFEDFTEDLAVWVLFYGPEGGEAARGC
jgi:mannose-6-phosphate isomerase-like protein (cupin superfamily)